MVIDLILAALVSISSIQGTGDPLLGSYSLDSAASDDPTAAVEEIVRSVPRMGRGRARDRLTPLLTPPSTMEIVEASGAYILTTDQGRSLRLVPGGDPLETESPNGDPVRITTTLQEGSLRIFSVLPKGTRSQVLTPEDDGLRMEVTYDLDVTEEPVTLRFLYRREGS